MNQGNNSGKKLSPQILIPAIVGAICVVVVLAVVLLATPKKATASQLQENLKLGSKYLESGEYDKAEVAFNDALKIDKKSTDATLGLANVYNGKKQPEKALNMLKKAGKNITSTSKSSMKKNSDVWNSRMNNYQNAFAQTKSLFQQQGNTSQVDAAAKEEQKVIENVTNIININIIKGDTPTPEPTVTPTPTPSDSMDDGSGDAASGGLEKEREVTLPPEQMTDPTVTVTPEDSDAQEDVDPSEDADITEEPSEDSAEQDGSDETTENTDEIDETDNSQDTDEGEEDESSYDYEVYNRNNASYNTDVAYNEDNTSDSAANPYDTDSNNEENNADDTSVNDSDMPAPGQEEVYNENTEVSSNNASDSMETQQGETDAAQQESDAAGTGSDEEILSAYAAQMEISKYTGGSISYTDSTSMAAVNGTLATEQRDFDGDQRPELLVVYIDSGKLEFELYKAENGEAQQIAYEEADPGFGDPVEGITYSGSQECFIKDNGTSVDIGIAGYYSGMSGENGTPEARLTVALYKFNSDGTLSEAGNAALVNGTQLYLNGTTSQEGGKDAFISELSRMGLSGSWVSESADALAAMDLTNNPMQDTAGVPNPVNAGLSSKETGIQDLAVLNVGMQPGSSSMDFSVK